MKTMTKPQVKRSLLALASLVFVGTGAVLWGSNAQAKCDDEAAHGKHATANDKAKHDHKAHGNKSSHAALGQKPNGSGVSMRATTPKSFAIGQPTRITINFGAADGDGATAKLQAPAGATITRVDGSAISEIALARGRATSVDVFVTAQADGMQYVDVTTSQAGRFSVQSIALKVGSGALNHKPSGALMTTPSGEKIISMPAK